MPVRTRLKLNPGQAGTKKLLRMYGDRLVCVRYRYDTEQKKRFKTVELVVDEVDWQPKARQIKSNEIVRVQVGLGEKQLQGLVRKAGGIWNPKLRLWELRYERVVELGIEGRIRR
jgi:hypothetical protein